MDRAPVRIETSSGALITIVKIKFPVHNSQHINVIIQPKYLDLCKIKSFNFLAVYRLIERHFHL
jgi:hypothetical protein